MATIFVKCTDGEVIETPREVIVKMAPAVRKKLDESGTNTITLDNVNSRSLVKVVEYCNAHSASEAIDMKSWDSKFVKVEPSVLCELASAAYHLEIKPMVDLTCYAIAQLLKGNTPEEIRRIFNIIYDFGPEDDVPPPTIRDKLRNKWIRRSNKRNSGSNSGAITQEQIQSATSPIPSPVSSPNLPRPTDTRSLDQLLTFIEATPSTSNGTSKHNKKTKRKKKKNDKQLNNHPPEDTCNENDKQEKDKDSTVTSAENSGGPADGVAEVEGIADYEETDINSESGDADATYENEDNYGHNDGGEDESGEEALDEIDREVEEFRLRLEAAKHNPGQTRQKVTFTSQNWTTS